MEKNFTNWLKIQFSQRKLSQIARLCCQMMLHPKIGRSFHLQKFPTVRYVNHTINQLINGYITEFVVTDPLQSPPLPSPPLPSHPVPSPPLPSPTDPYLPSTVKVPALVGPTVLPSLRLALQEYSPASCRPTLSMSSCRFSVLWITSESIGSLLCSHSNVT